MKKTALLASILALTGCSESRFHTLQVQGIPGRDGYTTFITTQVVAPITGSCGTAGGIKLVPYTDYNRNNMLDVGEETVLAASVICNGAQGAQGIQGIQGLVGAQGIQGLQGATGLMGPVGPQGVQGIQGITGAQGVAGPQGAQGLQGIQGIPGLTGATGAVGAQGPMGQPGIQGIPGNSSGMTPIQLCANDNSAFPELSLAQS